jgi:hypothetical protein
MTQIVIFLAAVFCCFLIIWWIRKNYYYPPMPNHDLFEDDSAFKDDFEKNDGEWHGYLLEEILTLSYYNPTDSIKTVELFQFFNDNEGVELTIGNLNMSLDYFRRYFMFYPTKVKFLRFNTDSIEQAKNMIYKKSQTIGGKTYKTPYCLLLDNFSSSQFQSNVFDVQEELLIDGLSYDLVFNLLPKSTIRIYLLPDSQTITLIPKKSKLIYGFTINNSGDELMKVDLFNPENIMDGNVFDVFNTIFKENIDYVKFLEYIKNIGEYKSCFEYNRLKVLIEPFEEEGKKESISEQLDRTIRICVDKNENVNANYTPKEFLIADQFQENFVEMPLGRNFEIHQKNSFIFYLNPKTKITILFCKDVE